MAKRQESTKETGCLQFETRHSINDFGSCMSTLLFSSEDPEENLTDFHDTVLCSAFDTIGPIYFRHQDWFDENDEQIQELLGEIHHQVYFSDSSEASA